MFIRNYAKIVEPINRLTRKTQAWIWGPEQEEAFAEIKECVQNCPALMPLRTEWPTPAVLAVDTSWKAVGYYIYQCDPDDAKRKYYAYFDSITLNEREARFSQPKRELYGLKRALEEMHFWFQGCRSLDVETDAQYIKGMLNSPGWGPNATINRWIEDIRKYHFTLRHVSGSTFPADGLSRREASPDDPVKENRENEFNEEWGPIPFEMGPGETNEPLDFDDFKHSIDTRGGYLQNVAENVEDIEEEIEKYRQVETRVQELADSRIDKCEDFETNRIDNLNTLKQFVVNTHIVPNEERREEIETHLDYDGTKRPLKAVLEDDWLRLVRKHKDDPSNRPHFENPDEYVKYKHFENLFRKDKSGRLYKYDNLLPKLVVWPNDRQYILTAAHDSLGHKGIFATTSLIDKRFWWPGLEHDIKWFVDTCKTCQERQMRKIKIPPMITETPSLFQTIHIDTMHVTPPSNGRKYIVQARDSLSSWLEAVALHRETASSIGQWVFSDIICRWGCPQKIVTDNAPQFKLVLEWLESKYGIRGITISPYNSKGNGKIERAHFDTRSALSKACSGDMAKWYWFLPHVLWADRVTIKKGLGCSPYFLVMGAEPVLPLDIVEATYLTEPPDGPISTEDVVGYRARALAKHRDFVKYVQERVSENKQQAARKYEENNKEKITAFKFKPGSLVLMRNSELESSLSAKMYPKYIGPYVVIRQTKPGSCILAELDGTVYHNKVAQFRLIPYLSRRKIELPENLHAWLDLSEAGMKELEAEFETNIENQFKEPFTRDLSFEIGHEPIRPIRLNTANQQDGSDLTENLNTS
jgi:hypothetical protein